MPKNYWFKSLFFLVTLLFTWNLEAQVKFKVALSPDSTSYDISLYSEIGPYASTVQNFIPTATVTLIAPTGQITPGTLTNHKGSWSSPDMFINPVAGLNLDYFVFTLSGAVNDIIFTPSLELPLFSFINSGICAGAVELMNNENDPFREQDPTVNVGNQITVFGVGQSNAYGGAYQPGSANCMGAPPCDLQIDTVNNTDISACGLSDGSITITASNGVGTIQYSINNGIAYFTNNIFYQPNIGKLYHYS